MQGTFFGAEKYHENKTMEVHKIMWWDTQASEINYTEINLKFNYTRNIKGKDY